MAPAAVTDAVMAQPLIALLRRFDAFGRIDVLAHADVAAVFRAVPEVDEVVQTDLSAERLALAGRFALSRRIEAQAYDCAFILEEAGTAALVPWLARIPLRIALGASALDKELVASTLGALLKHEEDREKVLAANVLAADVAGQG